MRRLALGLGALLLVTGAARPGTAAAPGLTQAGTKAFDLARASDDGAGAALDEGEQVLGELTALLGDRAEAQRALRTIRDQADAAHRSLAGYRKQAQISATEALDLLGQVARLNAAAKPDPIRRDVLEQRALLAAGEAAVMAARAETESERLRTLLATARLALAGPGTGEEAGAPAAARGAAGSPARASADEVEVPNLVGARLAGATRDLEAAGLRLGATAGPRDGYVVKQAPEAGTRVPRQAAIGVTLSGTAATPGSP